jgi:hypothetical protein
VFAFSVVSWAREARASWVWGRVFDWRGLGAGAEGGSQGCLCVSMQGRDFAFSELGRKQIGICFRACSCFSPIVAGVSSFDVHDISRNTAVFVASYVLH